MSKKFIPEVSQRERMLLSYAKNIKIVKACRLLVGILKVGWWKYERHYTKRIISSKLLVNDEENRPKYIYFEPEIERENFNGVGECYEGCIKYLSQFLGKDFIINFEDEEVYSPAVRMVTIEYPSSYDSTRGLYTFEGIKIPKIIRKNFDLEKLSEELKELKGEDFHFSSIDDETKWVEGKNKKESLVTRSLNECIKDEIDKHKEDTEIIKTHYQSF